MKTIILAIGLTGILFSGCTAEERPDRPNIILIMTDDQGYGDLGFHGNTDIRTPVLDSLAMNGTRFTRFYVNPVCAPTRAALMTGRYALRTGVYDTYQGGAIMHAEESTIAEILSENGYSTGIFGKWHLGDNYPFRPVDQGFSESLVHKGGGIGQPGDDIYNALRRDSSYFDPMLSKNTVIGKYYGYCSDIFTDAAIDFIDLNREEGRAPFFVYLSYNAPHLPLQVPDEYLERYEDLDIRPRNYAVKEHFPQMGESEHAAAKRVFAMISNIDDNVARLIKHLEDLEISGNTLLIFMTDNGPQQYRYNGGLRGKKGSVYEGGIRVPFFMNWEGEFPVDTDIDTPAANIDILPTLLDICGIQIPERLDLDGRSLLPLLDAGTVKWEERTLFFEWSRGYLQPYRNIAVRRGQYKLVGRSDYSAGRSALELYDIDLDPYEQADISGLHAGIVEELADVFDQWYTGVVFDKPLTVPPRIIIGSANENPVILSRQDWKGPGSKSWRSEYAFGYWDVSFAREGFYDVKLISPTPAGQPGTAYIRAGTIQRSRINRDTATSVIVLKDVPFRQGNFMLETWYDTGGGIQTPMYVEIKYTTPVK